VTSVSWLPGDTRQIRSTHKPTPLCTKMYGCFEPSVVYGFCEPTSDEEIDPEWIEEYHVGLVSGSTEVIRNNGHTTVYGVRASLNRETGQVSVDPDRKRVVERLYAEVGHTKNYLKLGYYLVVKGDVECCHTRYTPELRRRSSRLAERDN
jgi:hypothetical protein